MTIEKRLKRISQIFNIDVVLAQKPTINTVKKYYSTNKLAYSFFHSKENFIHLGISNGAKFKKEDLIEPVKFISKYIENRENFSVLELGTGRGANSKYLAQKYPCVKFTGIDITEEQLNFAKKVENKYKNYKQMQQDFHDLALFKDKSFNLVFVLESLCHSNDKQKVLSEVKRVLKENGIFIIIDGYLEKNLSSYTPQYQTAIKLTELGMAIEGSNTYKEFLDMVNNSKYEVEYEKNISLNVIPSMKRLERYSRIFFKSLIIAKFLKLLLPQEILLNAVTAYLWVPLTKQNLVGYYITVLKKNS